MEPVENTQQLKSKLDGCDTENTEQLTIRLYHEIFTETLSLRMLSQFQNLRRVEISGGSYSSIDLSSLQELVPLEKLIIKNNRTLREVDLCPVFKAPRIKSILLWKMPYLDTIKLDDIGSCESLRSLMFESGFIGSNLSLIGECGGLQELTFHARMEDIDLWDIAGLRNLSLLSIKLMLQSYRNESQPVDCTPLLALPKLMSLQLLSYSGHTQNMPIKIGLPRFVSMECGKTWERVNESLDKIEYSHVLSLTWRKAYPVLEEYASRFAPIYWPSINRYVLETCGVSNTRYHIDLARCVIPSDLLQLAEPEPTKPATEKIERALDENIVDMVTRYLEEGNDTSGFDIDKIATNEPRLSSFIPKVIELRSQEIRGLTFIQVPYRAGAGFEKWQATEQYHTHPLMDTVYGRQAIEDKESHINRPTLREQYMMPLKEIESIERRLNESDIETDWRYISVYEWR
ncbi:MAG: hypothetical protein ACFFEX_09115 [Candidatus Thorarchaeota archaeon]